MTYILLSTADKFKGQTGFIFTVDLKNMMETKSSYGPV